jgi:hypothetical protein
LAFRSRKNLTRQQAKGQSGESPNDELEGLSVLSDIVAFSGHKREAALVASFRLIGFANSDPSIKTPYCYL